MKHTCCYCDKEVTDGVDGDVSVPPPWSDEVLVTCYECANRQEEEHDLELVVQAAVAEERFRARA